MRALLVENSLFKPKTLTGPTKDIWETIIPMLKDLGFKIGEIGNEDGTFKVPFRTTRKTIIPGEIKDTPTFVFTYIDEETFKEYYRPEAIERAKSAYPMNEWFIKFYNIPVIKSSDGSLQSLLKNALIEIYSSHKPGDFGIKNEINVIEDEIADLIGKTKDLQEKKTYLNKINAFISES